MRNVNKYLTQSEWDFTLISSQATSLLVNQGPLRTCDWNVFIMFCLSKVQDARYGHPLKRTAHGLTLRESTIFTRKFNGREGYYENDERARDGEGDQERALCLFVAVLI